MTRHSLAIGFVVVLTALFGASAFSQEASGTYQQVSSRGPWGEGLDAACPTCTVTLTQTTVDLITIEANNGWVGYGVRDGGMGSYSGYWQWTRGTGGVYEGLLFSFTLTVLHEGLLLEGAVVGSEGQTYQIQFVR